MLNKNGKLPDDKFSELYKEMEQHKEDIKKKSRRIREFLSGDFTKPVTNGNGNGNGNGNHSDIHE